MSSLEQFKRRLFCRKLNRECLDKYGGRLSVTLRSEQGKYKERVNFNRKTEKYRVLENEHLLCQPIESIRSDDADLVVVESQPRDLESKY